MVLGAFMANWTKIGNGAYNTAYRSEDGLEVLKIQIITSALATNVYDTPKRSVRLWNKLNSHILPPAREVTIPGLGAGWICPYIEGRQSTDAEIREALIKIFNDTGRIIIDAASTRNFVTKADGQVVCLDIGQALELERRDGEFLVGGKPRRKSITSINAWRDQKESHIIYLNQPKMRRYFPETATTVKALLFIKQNYPDIFDVSFLKGNCAVISNLARSFDLGAKVTTLDLGALMSEAAAEESAFADPHIFKKYRQEDTGEVAASAPPPIIVDAAAAAVAVAVVPPSVSLPAAFSASSELILASVLNRVKFNQFSRDFESPGRSSPSVRLGFFAGGMRLASDESLFNHDSSTFLLGDPFEEGARVVMSAIKDGTPF